MELLRKEMNKELKDNKKTINKKFEEETIIINQQIREVDERCRLTEGEIQEFKDCLLYTSRCV